MRTSLFAFLIGLTIAGSSIGAPEKTRGVDPLLASVCLIVQAHGTSLVGSATGFFFQIETNKYLVSNRHVFTGESLPAGIPKPDRFILPLHANSSDLRQALLVPVSVVDTNGTPLWLEHPLGARVDVAMLALPEDKVKNATIHWLSEKNFPSESYNASPGQDLFVIGYPQGFHDRLFFLPVMRNALVASAYGVPFEGNQFFLIDAELHPGTSGSPVFSKPTNVMDGGMGIQFGGRPIIHLVGINSGEIKPRSGQKQKLGLHAAWYPSLLLDIHRHAGGQSVETQPQPSVSPIEDMLEKHGYSKRFLEKE